MTEITGPRDVGSLGEFGLIDRVVAALRSDGDPTAGAVVVGPGDDAAVVRTPDGRVVATTDLLVEGRHFRRDWSTGYDVGRRAAAANLADVAAMGAHPTAVLVGLACPPDLPVDWVDALATGLRDECAVCACTVVGGDVVRSDLLTIAVTALGDCGGRPPVTRAGARAGDVVVVAGRLGWAAAGLRHLRAGRPDGPLADALRRPEPPYALGPALAVAGATAMIDVSDGLAADAGHIAVASGVRVDLDLGALRALGTDGVTDEDLLTGGDDHALLATVPDRRLVQGLPAPGAVVVGSVGPGAGVFADGVPVTGGHDHFG